MLSFVYFFSFLFNKLYFNIFKVLKRYIFSIPKLYSTYSIKKKINYIAFLFILCILIFCKIFFFTYYYILVFYKIVVKIYINKVLKKRKILYLLFWTYWYNLLIHLKVLNKKFNNPIDIDIVYYTLKWNSFYYYYYIIYIFKDLGNLIRWLMVDFQWHILYLQVLFYFKFKKLKLIYYYKLFTQGFLGIYCFSGIKSLIKNIKNPVKSKKLKKKKKSVSFLSRVKFTYHRNKRILKEQFYSNVKQPMYIFTYFINNFIESFFFSLFKTGANSIIYYFYKVIKYSYSICVYFWNYLWKSEILYRFFKLIERKKW